MQLQETIRYHLPLKIGRSHKRGTNVTPFENCFIKPKRISL